ncbi:hypothetical protein ACFW04_011473 [Cataglyphis niger]
MNQNTFNSQQLDSFIFESSLYLVPFRSTHHLRNSNTLNKLKEFDQRGVAFLSAHDLIFIRYGIKLQRHGKLIICRDWNWTDVSVSNNINEKIDIYCTKLLNIFNAHVPLKRRCFRNLPAPWLTDGIPEFYRNFFRNYVMPRDIVRVISRAKSNAVGGDSISLRLLKLTIHCTLPILEHLFNFSLMNSVFPVKWKSALICPILKIRNPTLMQHYRPISVLSTLSKTLKRLSAYRNNHSTQTYLIRMLDEVRHAADRRMVTVFVFFDFSEAFHRMDYFLLIEKLKNLNFSESVLRWIHSYLTERTQAVKDCVEGATSSSSSVRTGVPQASVLRSLLFTLYLADFSHVVKHCKYNFYADDLQAYIHCEPRDLSDIIRKVNKDIDAILGWSSTNRLILNSDKI